MDANDIKSRAGLLREKIKGIEEDVRQLKDNALEVPKSEEFNQSEVVANAMLSVRHLEDARMRLGKAIQHGEGGKSIYDKKGEEQLLGGQGGSGLQ